MSHYPHFIPEFVPCTNSSLFLIKIANELIEFRNYLDTLIIKGRSRQVTGMVAWSWKSDNPEKKHAGSKLRFWGWHEPGEMKN